MLMSNPARAARLVYSANSFRVLTHEDHVACAVSGAPIPLDELRYWSVEHQQAYATAQHAARALAQ